MAAGRQARAQRGGAGQTGAAAGTRGIGRGDADAGRIDYGALQVANLLLELAWFTAHVDGTSAQAIAAVERLVQIMRGLQPGKRRFFRESLKMLPAALRAAADAHG